MAIGVRLTDTDAAKEVGWRTTKLNEEVLAVEPEICVERARFVTESFRQTEPEPMIIRRAKAIANVLEKQTIFIQRDQLIAGVQASKLRSSPVFPETESNYFVKEIDLFETREQDRLIIPPKVRKELLEDIFPYWKGKCLDEIALSAMPDRTRELAMLDDQVFSVGIHLSGSIGHIIADYDRIIARGFLGLREDAENYLKEVDFSDPSNTSKLHFYKSIIIICDGILAWGKRYAVLAREMAAVEADKRWKKELEEMAEICDRVPALPARNFREAVQSFWFAHLLCYIEQNGLAVSVGRFDQFMYPYYKKSIEAAEIKKEEGQELLECLWIKMTEIMRAYDFEGAKYYAGFSISENLVLGGVGPDGKDATNELSYMCLDAESHTSLSQPNLSVRVHNNMPEDFFRKAVRLSSTGRTKPQFFNDTVGIQSLLSLGVPLKDARDYSISGCVEAVPPHTNGMTNASMSNIAKALELALNDGRCRLSGKQIGPKTGNPLLFKDIEEVIAAFRTQVAAYVKEMVTALQFIEKTHAQYHPLPYFSLVIDDCLAEGKDITEGGALYNFTGPQAVGLSDVADSLAAIGKFVFDDQSVSMDQLLNALNKNFEGSEELRQMLSNKAPKYGNDDDYVDELAAEVAKIYCEEVEQYKNTRGGVYRPGVYSVSANVPLGLHVGATPNGRLARAALGDGVGPVQACDIMGPTAVTRSVSKLNHELVTNGTLLNQKFSRDLMSTEEGKQGLGDLVRSFFDLGGWHIQFNVVDAELLRAAQNTPQEHKDLIIRVAGYSAFFVELDSLVQDDIINRTEQNKF
ncbi:MAG TPA: formate C-acetyltransferase/glycerol dehydratase family glycyl radical enzyme [Spirochaeta sp.]|nr:formate C-acetyltransferase/glycerol dehydratase family glycyl radical enzyme [Spirochaeta sp.]